MDWGDKLRGILRSLGITTESNGVTSLNWQAVLALVSVITLISAYNLWSYFPLVAAILVAIVILVLVGILWKNRETIVNHRYGKATIFSIGIISLIVILYLVLTAFPLPSAPKSVVTPTTYPVSTTTISAMDTSTVKAEDTMSMQDSTILATVKLSDGEMIENTGLIRKWGYYNDHTAYDIEYADSIQWIDQKIKDEASISSDQWIDLKDIERIEYLPLTNTEATILNNDSHANETIRKVNLFFPDGTKKSDIFILTNIHYNTYYNSGSLCGLSVSEVVIHRSSKTPTNPPRVLYPHIIGSPSNASPSYTGFYGTLELPERTLSNAELALHFSPYPGVDYYNYGFEYSKSPDIDPRAHYSTSGRELSMKTIHKIEFLELTDTEKANAGYKVNQKLTVTFIDGTVWKDVYLYGDFVYKAGYEKGDLSDVKKAMFTITHDDSANKPD